MKKGFFWIIVLLLTAFASVTAQTDAPNAEKTFYYKQTGVVRNNNRTAGDNTGQFITFTRKGCYDSDKNGIQAGDGFLNYQGIGNEAHVYEGDTYWGRAFYYFTKDFNKYNVRTADGIIYVYEKTTPPATAITSAKVYTRPTPTRTDTVVINPPDRTEPPRIEPPVNNNNQGTTWDTTPTQPTRIQCSSCRGTGKCRVCGGSGKCTASNCDRGWVTSTGYSGSPLVYKCGVCNGSNQCGTCYNGSGDCRGCRGTGYYN